jgi:hypothetical protein
LSIPSPQFVTIQSKAKAFAKSLHVSVFPVPAGPLLELLTILIYQKISAFEVFIYLLELLLVSSLTLVLSSNKFDQSMELSPVFH